jgi:hypothetical protein
MSELRRKKGGREPKPFEERAASGRMTNEQLKFIEDNCHNMSVEQIALALDKTPEAVRNHIENRIFANVPREVLQARKSFVRLRESPAWKPITEQFFEEELNLLKFHFESILIQFKGDTTYTELLQILEVCKLEIVCDRMLKRVYDNEKAIFAYQETLADLVKTGASPTDIGGQQAAIAGLMTLGVNLNKDYKEITDKKTKVMHDIKGTRDQRIKRVEANKATLADLMIKLIEDPETRKAFGANLAKRAVAHRIEAARLSDYHKYCDGSVEQPILSADTLKEDNK